MHRDNNVTLIKQEFSVCPIVLIAILNEIRVGHSRICFTYRGFRDKCQSSTHLMRKDDKFRNYKVELTPTGLRLKLSGLNWAFITINHHIMEDTVLNL